MPENTIKSSGVIAAGEGKSAGVINVEQIKHIAHLARIGINDDDAKHYAAQMNSVLDYMKILDEVDIEKVGMTLQVNGLDNVARPDEVRMEENPADLLAVSPLPRISGQIAVRAVIKEE